MHRYRFNGHLGPALVHGSQGERVDGCARCGSSGPLVSATVRPVHKGGRRTRSNLRGLCAACLRLKRAEDR